MPWRSFYKKDPHFPQKLNIIVYGYYHLIRYFVGGTPQSWELTRILMISWGWSVTCSAWSRLDAVYMSLASSLEARPPCQGATHPLNGATIKVPQYPPGTTTMSRGHPPIKWVHHTTKQGWVVSIQKPLHYPTKSKSSRDTFAIWLSLSRCNMLVGLPTFWRWWQCQWQRWWHPYAVVGIPYV